MVMLTEGTVAAQFSLSRAPIEQIVERISDGEFHLKFLASFPDIDALKESCVAAVESMASEPFAGRKTCADVMGRAMELLRHNHGINTPRGWIPVMRSLRSNPGAVRRSNTGKQTPVSIGEPSAIAGYDLESRRRETAAWFSFPATELLTAEFSTLRVVDSECGDVLSAAANQNPDFLAFLVKTAEALGSPSCWAEALLFVDFVIAELGDGVPDAVFAVQKRLEFRCEDYWPPDVSPRENRGLLGTS